MEEEKQEGIDATVPEESVPETQDVAQGDAQNDSVVSEEESKDSEEV